MNKKCVSIGVTLFSSLILVSLSTQTVKADTVNSSAGSSGTVDTSSVVKTPVVSSTDTVKTSSTTSSNPSTMASTVSSSSTTTVGTVASTGTTSTGTTSTVKPSTTVTGTATSTPVSSSPEASDGTTVKPSSTTGTTTSASTATNPYAIPSNVTDSTIVNFADPLLAKVVKQNLNLKPTDNITVGAIKNFVNPLINVSVSTYQVQQKNTPGFSMTDQDSTPIESLDGMQYLQLLPKSTQVIFQAKLASDANANSDLTPLEKVNFAHLIIDGDLSDPKAKEIDLSPLAKFDLSKTSYLELSGDQSVSSTSGLNDEKLAEVAPVINKFANNGLTGNLMELGYSSISDFTPLKPAFNAPQFLLVAATNTVVNKTPVYAVTGQPIAFTAPKLLDPLGNDLASTYRFSYSVAQADLAEGNLTNTGGDNYVLSKPAPNAPILYYGNIGWVYSSDPKSYIREKLGNGTFQAILMNAQPIIWQAHPTVTITYVDKTGQPILEKGAPMKTVSAGNSIGDKYDFTKDSEVAGYTLTNPVTDLKGIYTQDPQFIKLVYSKLVSKSGSTTTKTVKPIKVEPKDRIAVKIYDVSGNSTGKDAYLADMGVKATTTINGKLFYLVGYGQWVEASSYNIVKSATAGIVRTFDSSTPIFNAYGKSVGVLPSNTAWKYSRTVTIDGTDYYQVAPDEFLPMTNSVAFTPASTPMSVTVVSASRLYDSKGESLRTILPVGSSWKTDGCAMINGVKMYRVATDEWISANDSKTYEPVATVYKTVGSTPLYDETGKVLARKLPAGTSWEVDQAIMINGQKYCRVATNEYVKA